MHRVNRHDWPLIHWDTAVEGKHLQKNTEECDDNRTKMVA